MMYKSTNAKALKTANLADFDMGVSTKSRRDRLFMRYSPLVERYLISHNYETVNKVRKL